MVERELFFASAVFVVLLTITLTRLGRSNGGAAWAGAWICLYGSGLAGALDSTYSVFAPAVPALGTAFSTLLFAGTLLFVERVSRFPRRLAWLGIGVAVARIAIQPFVSVPTSQLIGAVVITAAVLASSFVLLRPIGRAATLWEQILGYCFPLLVMASATYAACWYFELSVSTARYAWQLSAISIGFLQVSAFIGRSTAQIESFRAEAVETRNAHSELSELYREVTEQASDLICELDDCGTILYANPAHENVLGFKPDELVGQPSTVCFPNERTVQYGSLLRSQISELPRLRIVVAQSREGTKIALESSLRSFRVATGETRVVITSRDVTQQIDAERTFAKDRVELEALVEERTVALQRSLDELEQSSRLAAIGTLAAGIAHQINNPIGSIQMSAEFALSDSGSEDERDRWREALMNSVDQAKRCGLIVSNILQFARNETVTKTEEDLAVILRRICEQKNSYARDLQVSIDTSGIEGPLPILGSAIALEQAVLNILKNAAESSADEVHVSVCATDEDGFAHVTISDDGDGMDQEEADRAFDPFFTTRLVRGGTGLGLSVAHGVVTDHGGILSIESENRMGTKMTLILPLLGNWASSLNHPAL